MGEIRLLETMCLPLGNEVAMSETKEAERDELDERRSCCVVASHASADDVSVVSLPL